MEGYPKAHERTKRVELTDTTLTLERDGATVGSAHLYFGEKPYPYYYLANIRIDDASQGNGYGTELMQMVEEKIRASGVTGLLVDDIDPTSPASGMYRRRGWKLVPGTEETYYFNLQEGQDPEKLRAVV
jgi:N-acetylglutamate synthase-like GNAT family acetyltransferase